MSDIAVIVPVYNVEAYVEKCVDSILAQTYRDFELLLVDDGSKDKSGEICDAYVHKDDRIHVIHQKNGGLSAARNTGIDWAFERENLKHITFVDSDDWVSTNYLDELVKGCKTLNVRISCLRCNIEGGPSNYKCKPDKIGWQLEHAEDYWIDFDVLPQSACGKLFDKQLFQDVRFPLGKLHEDEFTTHLLLFPCGKIAVSSKGLYHYVVRDDSITHDSWSPRRMDSVDALLGEFEYFRANKFPKAAEYTIERIMGQMMLSILGMKNNGGDFGDRPEKYKAFIEKELQRSKDGFWKHRGFYRELHPMYFALMWFPCMVKDALLNGSNSWLCQESIPIIKECIIGSKKHSLTKETR